MGRNCTFRIGAVDVMNSTSDGGTGAHCPHSQSVTGMDSRRRPVRRSLVLATSVLLVTPAAAPAAPPITPAFVRASLLDGRMRIPPDVTVDQDTAAAPQTETTIAVDPNNPRRIVAGANDYVSRTWSCTVNGT